MAFAFCCKDINYACKYFVKLTNEYTKTIDNILKFDSFTHISGAN